MPVDDAMRIHATQDEIGCRVIVHNLKSRPALNRLAGTIVSLDHKPGGCRCGVRVDGQGEPLSLSRSNLMRERTPPWDNCRHGGPPLDPAMAAEFIMAASQLTAPTLGHVALLEPHVRKYAPPAVLFASMGVDAYIEEDSAICRGFAVLASTLDGVHSMGADGFFASVASRVAGHPASPAVAKLEARLAKCTSASGLFEVLGEFVSCHWAEALGDEWSCLQIAAHRGIGLKQSDIDPQPSPVDAVF